MARGLTKRDPEGLLPDQRRLLQAMVGTGGDPKRACEQEQIPWQRYREWYLHDPAFQERYADLIGVSSETIRTEMERLGVKAVAAYDEALEAERVIEIPMTCEECGHEQKARASVSNPNTRLRAGDTVLRVSGVLKNVSEMHHTSVRLNFEEVLALAAFRQNRPIPPHLETRLKEKGKITESGEVIDGEARAVP